MKNVQYYLELPYTMIMHRDEEGDYVARIARASRLRRAWDHPTSSV